MSPELLRDDLKNLRIINKYFGGLRTVRKHILPMFEAVEGRQTIRILDLATASADHPIALVALAEKLGRNIEITAVDRNPVMLEVARARSAGVSRIRIEEADLLRLPYEEESYDIVLCSLVLHHFSRGDAIRIIRNIHRVARVGWIVHDLYRSWPAAWTAWIYTHLTTRNQMTLFDSYYSVLRGFTPREFREIALEAGIDRFAVSTHPFFRLVLARHRKS